MSRTIYIRPLVVQDALVSYAWRNNPILWRYTGSKPDRYITPEIETAWLENVLKRENERRFAICLTENDKYIGNIFLTDCTNKEAQMHIFIGDVAYWGKGRACEAIEQIFQYAFDVLQLETIYCNINHKNLAALSLAKLAGFVEVADFYEEQLNVMVRKMVYARETYFEQLKKASEEQTL